MIKIEKLINDLDFKSNTNTTEIIRLIKMVEKIDYIKCLDKHYNAIINDKIEIKLNDKIHTFKLTSHNLFIDLHGEDYKDYYIILDYKGYKYL